MGRAALLQLLISPSAAHLVLICTSTSPDKAESLNFYFGTYHNGNEFTSTAPGLVTITAPDGTLLSNNFSDMYTAVHKADAGALAHARARTRSAQSPLPCEPRIPTRLT